MQDRFDAIPGEMVAARTTALGADRGAVGLMRRRATFVRVAVFPLSNRYTATRPVVVGLLAFFIRYRLFGCSGLRGARSASVFSVCSGVAV